MPHNAILVMSLIFLPFLTVCVPPQAGETKYDVAITNSKFKFGDTVIRLGTTQQTELEKLLGKDYRKEIVIDVDTELAVWDDKGVRAFYRKSTNVLTCLDFMYTAPEEKNPFPRKVFVGVFNVDGKGLSATTTKADVKAPSSKAIEDSPFGQGDYEIIYEHHRIQVFQNKDRKTIEFVKVLPSDGRETVRRSNDLLEGNIQFNKGNYARAIELYKKEIEANPDSSARRRLANCYHLTKEYDKAVAVYNEVLKRWPEEKLGLIGRGQTWKAKKDYDRAIADFRKTIEIYPDDVDGHKETAWFLATCPSDKHRDGMQAVKAAEKMFEAAEKNTFYGHWDVLAAAHAEAGNFDKAVATQEAALAKAEKHPGMTRSTMDGLQVRLNLYQQKKPYREE